MADQGTTDCITKTGSDLADTWDGFISTGRGDG